MLFLVEMWQDGPMPSSPAEKEALRTVVVASLITLDAWAKENKIKGGMPIAGRSVTFILEAESPEQADDLLCELPLWNVMNIKVQTLTPFSHRLNYDLNINYDP